MSVSQEPNAGVPRRHLVAVFLVALAVLVFEVSLTRVFSVVLHHHYVFLAVSMAICGLGLGGFALHAWRARAAWARAEGSSESVLAGSAVAFALTSCGVLVVLLEWLFPYHIDQYWLAGALMLVPFVAAGAFLAEVFVLHGAQAGRVYAWDLSGSAFAAVAVVGLLQWFGAINACLAAAAFGAWAAFAVAPRTRARAVSLVFALVCAALPLLNAATDVLAIGAVHGGGEGAAALAKPLFADLAKPEGERPVIRATRWNAFARTDLVENPGFGEFRNDIFQVFTDGHVPTYLLRVGADLRKTSIADAFDKIPAIEHCASTSILAFRAGSVDRTLCIGPGAGSDVLLALIHGAQDVDAAELNPSIVELVKESGDFCGHLYEHPAVHAVTAEGRSFVRQAEGRYDLIFSALTQTATSMGAAALMEDYVYTREAFGDYWDHVTPHGRIAFIVHSPELSMRLVATALALLAERGLDQAAALEHLALFEQPDSPYRFLLLLSRAPWQPADLDRLADQARTLELGTLFLPGRVAGVLEQGLGDPQGLAHWMNGAQTIDPATGATRTLDLSPCTDDRPFFFDIYRGLPDKLGGIVVFALLLASGFTALALALRRNAAVGLRAVAPFAFHFALLGGGFMLIEIPLIQKLTLAVGYPTVALTSALFGLLIGGGAGSAFAGRCFAEAELGRAIRISALATAAITIVLAATLPHVDLFLLRQPMAVRIGAVVVGLAALGFCLGMPFPSGIRMLARTSPADIPWMWGVNGVLSVVGSLAAVILGGAAGFRAALYVGAGLYVAVALWSFVLARAPTRAEGAN
jgi:hypothetical protein